MQLTPASPRGQTLIEVMIVLVILGILMAMAAQSYHVWIANSQIRTAAETLVEGLSAARNSAIQMNRSIRFGLVSTLSSECEVSSTGTSWVASVEDPSGKCDADISETVAPIIIAKKSAGESTSTVTIAALDVNGAEASTLAFNGLGRVVSAGAIAQIDIDSSALSAEQSRELRIIVTMGGMIRMCDPSVTEATDPRAC